MTLRKHWRESRVSRFVYLKFKKMIIKSVPEYYIWVCDYEWPFKAAAISHAKSFENGIWRWNPIVNKYEVFRPEYSK